MQLVLAALVVVVALAIQLFVPALLLRLAAGWASTREMSWSAAFLTVFLATMVTAVVGALAGPGLIGALLGFVAWAVCIGLVNGYDAMTSLSIAFGMTLLSLVLGVLLFAVGIALLGMTQAT